MPGIRSGQPGARRRPAQGRRLLAGRPTRRDPLRGGVHRPRRAGPHRDGDLAFARGRRRRRGPRSAGGRGQSVAHRHRVWPAAATVRTSAGWVASIRSEEDDPVAPDDRMLAPWVALAYDGSPAAAAESKRILDQVRAGRRIPAGRAVGTGLPHYWIDKVRPGLARLWPLPWPGRYDRAGWRTILVSWLLMLLIAALAVLIAILIFRNQPPQTPPTPTGGSGSPPPSASASPQSGSPQSGSPQSGSPSGSPQSGSPSGSQSGSPSGSIRRRPVGLALRPAERYGVRWWTTDAVGERRSGEQLAGIPAVSSTETT